MQLSNTIKYVGVNDHDITLFEGQYVVENGMAYNSYVILDQKIAVVAHGGVIRRFTGIAQIAHCSLSVVDYHEDFACFGWV